nr:triple tyrosine motif-containing protein [Flavobacteriales bacterium]
YDTRMLTLGFSVMDHTAPAKNQYRYRMSGLYEEWVRNGASNRATFTNLDPGHYTFQVQGRNSAGVWDQEGASLSIVITPPWWGTWWFRALVVLAVAGLLYAFYRYRLARALEVVSVRDRIARDLHDEIGSTLSSVALYSTVARNKAGDRVPEANAMLDRITESTTEVMEAMNDIVWAVNSKNDDMAQVVQRMRAFGVAITEAAGMQLKLEVEPGVQAMTLDMAQRRDLYLIFKEAVNNAVKYGQAGTVRVSLARAAGRVQLVVEDDGVGFEPDAPSSNGTGGNGLPNMRRRAREMGGELTIASVPGTGTRISLRFDPRNRKSLDRMTSDGRDST